VAKYEKQTPELPAEKHRFEAHVQHWASLARASGPASAAPATSSTNTRRHRARARPPAFRRIAPIPSPYTPPQRFVMPPPVAAPTASGTVLNRGSVRPNGVPGKGLARRCAATEAGRTRANR